ncbi:MAG: hypothetical protein J6T85_01555 [Paludibacteraceae bacterium]|nr:hypothetical protein [Paludibacteraceae bacterium]
MARIRTVRPIESISGKLKKSDSVCFALRSKTKKNYTQTRDNWSMHYLSADTAASAAATQDKFRRVAAAVKVRKMDMEHQAADQLAFRNQSKYTTLHGFLFATVWATIDD